MGNAVETLIATLEEEATEDRDLPDTPHIGIIMGSDSDLDVMSGAHNALSDLGFTETTAGSDPTEATCTFESYVVSAHRTPDLMYTYARTATDRGVDVIIAGAGGKSADLPNMTASIAYPLPVIGVPVQEKSVNSVIGMPKGAPIVAVDAGKSFNAALSAVQMLSIAYPALREQLTAYHTELRDGVGTVSQQLHRTGTPAFLSEQQEQ